jgi:hypothetical protein
VSNVEFIQCDFEDLKQVDKVAKDLAKLDRLDAVCARIDNSRYAANNVSLSATQDLV